jgi:hypothetical protein
MKQAKLIDHLKQPKYMGGIVASLFFMLYLSTMPSTNVGYGDSDLLLTVGKHLGVAHPPGYPLYILLLYTFIHLPLNSLTIAAKGHLLSVVLGTLTLYVLYQLIHLLLTQSQKTILKGTSALSITIATVSSIIALGLSHNFWLYSTITEKYALLGTLATLTTFFITKALFETNGSKRNHYLIAASALLGLSISHHQLLLVLLIPYSSCLYLLRQSLSLMHALKNISVFIITLLTPLLLLFPINARQVPVSWSFEPTVNGWFNHVIRSSFYGDSYGKNEHLSRFVSSIDINQGGNAVVQFLYHISMGFGWWILVPLLIFLQKIFSKRDIPQTFATILFTATGLVVAFLLKWPEDWGSQGILMRQWYSGAIFLTPLIAFGIFEASKRLFKVIRILKVKPRFQPLLLLPLLIAYGFQWYQHYPLLNFKSNTLISDRYHNLLNEVSPGSLVTCFSDTSCFALLYEQSVNGIRPDVDIVPLQFHLVNQVINKPNMRGFTYTTNPYLIADIVTWNLRSRPVYAVELSSYYYQFFGLDIPFMYFIPHGYYGEFSYSLPKTIPAPSDYTLSRRWLEIPVSKLDPFRSYLATTPARDHLTNAQSYLKMDQRRSSLEELYHASNIFNLFTSVERQQMEGVRTQLEQMQPALPFAPGSRVESAETLLGYIPELLEKNFRSRALRAAQGAILIEPTNIEARLTLAKFYQEMGDLYFAKLEYLHVILLDPQNQKATDELATLSKFQ